MSGLDKVSACTTPAKTDQRRGKVVDPRWIDRTTMSGQLRNNPGKPGPAVMGIKDVVVDVE
jgi:hypothetical protein